MAPRAGSLMPIFTYVVMMRWECQGDGVAKGEAVADDVPTVASGACGTQWE
jgi:hypothetical protein